jgi:hypothetical protein
MLAGAPYFLGPYLISPHPKAPHFEDPVAAAKIFQQILTEAASANFNPNQEAHGLIRELGFVSLYFLLNSILAPFGPYQALDDPLSLNMCNFRQSEKCLRAGAQAFMFMPRGFSKSRVNTTGGGTFDLLRDPDEQMIIVNAISDKAEEFVGTIQKNFVNNDLIKEFYPEYIPGKKGKVTTGELVLPNRTRHLAAPTLKCFGLTGAAEGGHYSTILLDDLVGLDSVDSGYQSNAMMLTAKKWWGTNLSALRLTLASRELGAATRYAMDDCYEDVYKSCASVEGWQKGDLQPTKDGLWDVYYRLVEEDGFYLRPDVMDKKHLDDLVRTNPIAAMLNYYNSPTRAGLAEFVDANPGEAQLFFDQDRQEFLIRKGIDNFSDEVDEGDIRLRDCDLVLTTDLAATEKGANAKTCRSSIAVWAQDWDGNKYRLWCKVGFFDIYKSIDHIFDGYDFFGGLVRKVFIEANAFQKIVKPVIEREMEIRKKYLPLEAVLAQGDKKARIRVALGPNLAREKIWLVRGADKEFREELRIFPMSDTRVDVLDESEKAIVYLQRPMDEGERVAVREAYEEREAAAVSLGAMGY